MNAADKGADQPLHILVCPDQPDWAFDNIARNIARHSGPNTLSKLYMRDVIGDEHRFYEAIFLKRIDLCHVFWREDLFHLFNPATIRKAAQTLGLDAALIIRAMAGCAFTTSVYDHLFSSRDDIEARRDGFLAIDGYTVASERLRRVYEGIPGLPGPDTIISDGVDSNRFTPRTVPASDNSSLAIGWAGNSAWGHAFFGYDVKGFHRIFLPMLDELGRRGIAAIPHIADSHVSRVAFEDMPDFYRGLDIFTCTSAIEGTPNPVLEAMACGIPVVSSDVGIVPELFGPLQQEFIIRGASPSQFADAIAILAANPALRQAIGEENRQRAVEWNWSAMTRAWWPFWRATLARAMDPRHAGRRESWLLALLARIEGPV